MHYERAAQGMRCAAIQAFGNAKPLIRKPYTLESTVELVHARRHAAEARREAPWAVPFSSSSLVAHAHALLSGVDAHALASHVDGREEAEEAFVYLRHWAYAFVQHHVDAYQYLLAVQAALARTDIVVRRLVEGPPSWSGRRTAPTPAAAGAIWPTRPSSWTSCSGTRLHT